MSFRAIALASLSAATLLVAGCFSGPSFDLHVQTPGVAVNGGDVELVVPDGYTLHDTIDCSGTDDIRLEGAYIEVMGTAIIARDTCTITLVDSQIISHGGVALDASGAGDIVLEGCLVQGAEAAVRITGASDVTANASTIIGPIYVDDAGDFNRGPGTEVRSR